MIDSIISLFFLLFLAAVGVVIALIPQYNGLQAMAQAVLAAHSNIMISMKKRVDLVNKLIEVVTSYADHEKLTFITIAKGSTTNTEVTEAFSAASGAIRLISQLASGFPELKANQSYQMLMHQLSEVEADLQKKRESYNQMVQGYNTRLTMFPTNIWARALGFNGAPYFDVENADELQNLNNFKTDDGELLRSVITNAGQRVAQVSTKIGQTALEKGRQFTRPSQPGNEGVVSRDTTDTPSQTDLPEAPSR